MRAHFSRVNFWPRAEFCEILRNLIRFESWFCDLQGSKSNSMYRQNCRVYHEINSHVSSIFWYWWAQWILHRTGVAILCVNALWSSKVARENPGNAVVFRHRFKSILPFYQTSPNTHGFPTAASLIPSDIHHSVLVKYGGITAVVANLNRVWSCVIES